MLTAGLQVSILDPVKVRRAAWREKLVFAVMAGIQRYEGFLNYGSDLRKSL